MIAAVPLDHRLASAVTVSLDDFDTEPFIGLRRDLNPLSHKHLLEAAAARGLRPRIEREVTTFQECLYLAGGGLGVTLIPAWMRHDEVAAFPPLTQSPLLLPCELVWRSDTWNDEYESFTDAVKRVAGSCLSQNYLWQ